MRKEVSPEPEDLQKELDWYEDLNRSVIKLDRGYMAYAITYHCIEPDVRDELATGITNKHYKYFEYTPGGELPIPIKQIRELDTCVRNARFLARRGRWADLTWLTDMKEEATHKLKDLDNLMCVLDTYITIVGTTDNTGRNAVVDGYSIGRFIHMGAAQRNRFLHWASQTREVRIARKRGSVKNVIGIAQLILGEEERAILEWPGVLPSQTNQGSRWRDIREAFMRRETATEAERELRESHGPGAAFQFR
jgi:hypothetical protein